MDINSRFVISGYSEEHNEEDEEEVAKKQSSLRNTVNIVINISE